MGGGQCQPSDRFAVSADVDGLPRERPVALLIVPKIRVARFASLSDELGVSAERFFLSRGVLVHLTLCLSEVRNFTVLV